MPAVHPESVTGPQSGARRGGDPRAAGAADAPGGAGLVHSETSDTRFTIDPHEARCARMHKGVLNAARLIEQRERSARGRRPWRPAFLTLTYRDTNQFTARQVTGLLKCLRQWGKRRGITLPYVWVLERGSLHGRLHYHVIVWLPPGLSLPKPDKQGWWPWGMTQIKRLKNPVGYAAKYAGKDSDPPPKGARMHGCGGLVWADRLERAWWSAPKWVREIWPDPYDMPRRAPGGGWCSKVSGEWRPSPYEIAGFHAGKVIVQPRSSP